MNGDNLNISQKVNELCDLTSCCVDELKIIKSGNDSLAALRLLWTEDRSKFSTGDVLKLQQCAQIIKVTEDFLIELEDFNYLRTKEDVDDVLHNLYEIMEKLNGCSVSGKVAKEVRALTQKKTLLPESSERNQNNKLLSAKRTLMEEAPVCKKCGKKMLLREGNGNHFWGCRDFPSCWGRKLLTNEEMKVLEG
ncbi:TPA: topoisomerase DNA-binding C4 zinc finger domain-containing protein [Vibrio parahaemolyticus]|nr:hypothetical protein [Vibrio parahaemolyticus]HCG8418243.1 topoisomerase DNA-binding C4 zinc finger domain-containing protein [Vibrio parahaemolyticus]